MSLIDENAALPLKESHESRYTELYKGQKQIARQDADNAFTSRDTISACGPIGSLPLASGQVARCSLPKKPVYCLSKSTRFFDRLKHPSPSALLAPGLGLVPPVVVRSLVHPHDILYRGIVLNLMGPCKMIATAGHENIQRFPADPPHVIRGTVGERAGGGYAAGEGKLSAKMLGQIGRISYRRGCV